VLHDDEWLFADDRQRETLEYSVEFVRETGNAYLTFLELRSRHDLEVAERCFAAGDPLGEWCHKAGLRFGRELHMTDDAWRFTPVADVLSSRDPRDPDCLREVIKRGYLLVSEEDSIHCYSDHWTERPAQLTRISSVLDKEGWLFPAQFPRLFFRRIATVVDARSFMVAVVPAGWLSVSPQTNRCAGTVPVHRDLDLLSLLGSYTTDWNLRLRITATLNVFIFEGVPVPRRRPVAFLAHSALRLTCNHGGYELLWRNELGRAWREPKEPFTWPVLEGADERWAVRAAIDAVVADAYGLSREQYEHVLSTFSHKSYPQAPALCLAAFDELKRLGLDAFTRKHDPYWDIPLNDALPEPDPAVSAAIEKALAEAGGNEGGKKDLFGDPVPTDLFGQEIKPKGRRRRRS